jgi:uncharacterized protein
MRTTFALILSWFVALPVLAAEPRVPLAIYTDPPHDAKFPAEAQVLHIPTHGVAINGLAYIPAGAGPFPVFVLCHGLPGNEKNLDLAQAVRRAGWVAVTFNYRGSWGSPGNFSFLGNLDDAAAVLAHLRDPATAKSLRLDPKRIVIGGHSMGGWVAARTAAGDPAVIGAVLISAWDPSAPAPHEKLVEHMAGDMESLAGVTPESMAAQIESHIGELKLISAAPGLAGKPVLVLTSDDGLAPADDALVAAIRSAGGKNVATQHGTTDHSWSDRRIELESSVIRWLEGLRRGS